MSGFAARCGPRAVVAGASEGVGLELARKIAANGVHCILIARREGPLAEGAERIRSESGVECIPASIDLAVFLDRKIETWEELVARNVSAALACCHHFGGLMRERRRGGLLLVSSGAAWSGAPFMAVYSASKAFELRFGADPAR